MEYDSFIRSKTRVHVPTGITAIPPLNGSLFDFQADIVRWALRRGRAAIFADCGMGKAIMALEWARVVHAHTQGCVLILTPLAVAEQMLGEASKFHVDAPIRISRDGSVSAGITITNYQMLHRFTGHEWAGVVLDESSIIKAEDGATRNAIMDAFRNVPFKLACTATPAPNDHVELGNHSEFLGSMSRVEMLATFFCHDGGETSTWRLKGHARSQFWRWVASWAVMIRRPSDVGYDDGGFRLPPLRIHEHTLATDTPAEGMLFALPALTLEEQRGARRATVDQRVSYVAGLVNASSEPWLVWCELNDEGDALEEAIDDAVQVAGSDEDSDKVDRMLGFASGRYRVLVTKGKIAGFGMNWQHCSHMAFVGPSHSYEQFYQSVRRCWRFGQRREVNVHVVTTDIESAVFQNVKRKAKDAEEMAEHMVSEMSEITNTEIRGTERKVDTYRTSVAKGQKWELHLGDCVDVVSAMPSESVHYAVFSPPFASLYTYSASDRDMGNCRDTDEFMAHFRFLVDQLLRVTIPGRNLSFHCMNLPISKEREGFIGIRDFRGELIRAFVDAGWIYHSEVCIWKDPVTAMQRTKALGLLHKQLKKDSCMSRQGIADYLVTMRKPGDNPERVTHTNESFPVEMWQRYASPVWMDINPSDTLQYRSARENEDERHICPLQLEVIRRAVTLWSNHGDVVLSPFAGIGSEGVVALEEGRRFVGAELKESYFRQAAANLATAETVRQPSLFG
jgi:superfamily II DNA or RNA helicase